jgi:hypothetical protein
MKNSPRIFAFRNRRALTIVSTLLVLAVILLIVFIRLKQQEVVPRVSSNFIQRENTRPGTPGWTVTKRASRQIQAYAEEPSINKGGIVHLYVSTSSPSYTIDIYRLGYYHGVGARLVKRIPFNTGIYQGYYPLSLVAIPVDCKTCVTSLKDPQGRETDITDANWEFPESIEFSPDWISGIYYLKLTESKDGYQWAVPVVLRDDTRKADLVFEDPVNTDQAYNTWGGADLYDDFRHPGMRYGYRSQAYYVSFDRPYINGYGVGQLFDWTYSMLRFLEQNGYDVIYTTNDAVSEGQTNLMNYKGFVVGGHDEYWDDSERQKLEQAISKGVSAAFFSANAMYWQIRYTTLPNTNHKAIICYKYPELDPYSTDKNLQYLTTTRWRDKPVNDPEDRVFKAMYVSLNADKLQDFVAKNTSSWVYSGTNMKDGDTIKRVVGLEIDTTFSDGSITSNDRVTIIGESPYIDQYGRHLLTRAVLDEPGKGNNILFDASSYVWPDALSDFQVTWKDGPVPESSVLERITDNILQRIIHRG